MPRLKWGTQTEVVFQLMKMNEYLHDILTVLEGIEEEIRSGNSTAS